MRDRTRGLAFPLSLAALAAGTLGLLLLPPAPFGAAAHEPELSRYTYWRDIRPLMERSCASCHSGSGPAPVNLMRYADALPWANSVARQVLERRMPPWLPEDGTGEFAHARTLDERETDMLVDWAIGLAPEGAPPADEPPAPEAPASLPASRLTLAEPVRIGEMESEASVCAPLVRGAGVPEAAAGFALIPGEAVSILRRAVLVRGGDCGSGTPIFTWVVGQGARRRPEGAFDPLPAEAGLFLELAYRKGFDTEGLAFEDAPQLVVFPAGAEADAAVETLTLDRGSAPLGPASVLAVLPPPDLDPGADGFRIEAVEPDGRTTPLLRIRRFDADWAEKFVFRQPLRLAEGAAVRASHPGAVLDLIRPPDAASGPAPSGEDPAGAPPRPRRAAPPGPGTTR